MTNVNVSMALEKVRAAARSASRNLNPVEYKAFLEELMADAEGWNMELEMIENKERENEH